MKQRIICKSLAVAVIPLFIGLAIQPSIAVQTETEIDVEPKDYLFQTIIDIANNPDVKKLLEQQSYDLFKVDIDRSVYRQILLRNPRLMFNALFTKPSLSVEYLNRCYNNGIEITNIVGEDKALEFIEVIKISDTRIFDEFNNIIMNDKELSSKIAPLKEFKKEMKSYTPWEYNPLFCYILTLLIFVLVLIGLPLEYILNINQDYGLFPILASICLIPYRVLVYLILILLFIGFIACGT